MTCSANWETRQPPAATAASAANPSAASASKASRSSPATRSSNGPVGQSGVGVDDAGLSKGKVARDGGATRQARAPARRAKRQNLRGSDGPFARAHETRLGGKGKRVLNFHDQALAKNRF